MPPARIELAAHGLGIHCSIHWATGASRSDLRRLRFNYEIVPVEYRFCCRTRYHHCNFFKNPHVSDGSSPEFVKQPYTNSNRFASALPGFIKSVNPLNWILRWRGRAVRKPKKHRVKRIPCGYYFPPTSEYELVYRLSADSAECLILICVLMLITSG